LTSFSTTNHETKALSARIKTTNTLCINTVLLLEFNRRPCFETASGGFSIVRFRSNFREGKPPLLSPLAYKKNFYLLFDTLLALKTIESNSPLLPYRYTNLRLKAYNSLFRKHDLLLPPGTQQGPGGAIRYRLRICQDWGRNAKEGGSTSRGNRSRDLLVGTDPLLLAGTGPLLLGVTVSITDVIGEKGTFSKTVEQRGKGRGGE